MVNNRFSEENISKEFKNRDNYNKDLYIEREDSEKNLKRLLSRNKQIFVHGNNGCGKTWLVEHVLINEDMKYEFINLTDVHIIGGFTEYFKSKISQNKVSIEETTNGGIGIPGVAALSGEKISEFEITHNYLWEYLSERKKTVLILDNFEKIIEYKDLLDSVSDLLTLTDSKQMIEFGNYIIVIGTLNNMIDYLTSATNNRTISTRIKAMEVQGFTLKECNNYVQKRFINCGMTSTNFEYLSSLIMKETDGIPHSMCDLGYYIAINHFDNKNNVIDYQSNLVKGAIHNWIKESLSDEYYIISKIYQNNIRLKNNKNLILYALIHYDKKEFSSSQIFGYIDGFGMHDKKGVNTSKNVKVYLDELANEDNNNNILIKIYEDGYRIKSIRILVCLQNMLYEENNIIKIKEL